MGREGHLHCCNMMLSVNGDRFHNVVAVIALVMGVAATVMILSVDNESTLSSMDPTIKHEASKTMRSEFEALEHEAKQVERSAALMESQAPKDTHTSQFLSTGAAKAMKKKVKKMKKKAKKAAKKVKAAKKAKKALKKAAKKGGKKGKKAKKKLK